MRKRFMRRTALAWAVALVAVLIPAGAAWASPERRDVRVQDDCDPATFNAVLGPGACVGDGDTTFSEFIAQLEKDGDAGKWRFDRERFGLDDGGTIRAMNKGGEFHTFTEVRDFGGGCIRELNAILGLTPVRECQPLIEVAPGVQIPLAFVQSGLEPGQSRSVRHLAPGVHRFECLIHPWMHSVVPVRS